MTKRLIAILLIAAVLIFPMAACSNSSDTSPSQGTEADDTANSDRADQLYILVSGFHALEFMQNHIKGFEAACEELGVRSMVLGPDDGDSEAMVNAYEQAIAMNPAGIVAFPLSEMNAMTNKATEADIPVVYVDLDWPETDRISYCGTGNYEMGLTGGAYLADILGGEGEVAMLYAAGGGDQVTQRTSGYEDALEAYPDIEIVATGDTQTDYERATTAAAAILQANPNLSAFVCLDSTGGTGAATAVKEAGLEGKVKILSLDKDTETLRYIKDGIISATLAQNTALMSYYAVQILYSINSPAMEKMGYTDKMGIWPVPYKVDTGSFIIDSSNIDSFLDS